MVSDVEEGGGVVGVNQVRGDESSTTATASLVWDNGEETDGFPLRMLGPCHDDSDALEDNVEAGGAPRPLAERCDGAVGALANAKQCKERGNARFRGNVEAEAAAAEYVEAVRWLVRACLAPGSLPGKAADWAVGSDAPSARHALAPPPTSNTTQGASTNERGGAEVGAAAGVAGESHGDDLETTPVVGMRVKVRGVDGSARAGMVSFVAEDESVCDVMFDECGPGEEDEVGLRNRL